MTNNLFDSAPVIPIVQADDPKIAVETAKALRAGGMSTIEVVMRTDAAIACMEAIIAAVPDVTVGAGTVLTVKQVEEAVRRGAKFIVSPGLNEGVIGCCKSHQIDAFPGVVTPSEVQLAWNWGLRTVKFFPAGLAGGVPMLKALSSVFREMQFMPTGGISASNLKDYLSTPSVVACGGSWLTPQKEIIAGNYDEITALAREALEIAHDINPKNQE